MKEQVEEMAKVIDEYTEPLSARDIHKADFSEKFAEHLYNAGYRKQSEGEWIITNNRNLEIIRECSHCHAKTYYPIALRFNCRLTRYCEDCGAKMTEDIQ